MSKAKSKQKSKQKSRAKVAAQLTLKGKLEVTRSGMGYVIVENVEGDVLVRPGDFNTGLKWRYGTRKSDQGKHAHR
jgi:ribonuclease R